MTVDLTQPCDFSSLLQTRCQREGTLEISSTSSKTSSTSSDKLRSSQSHESRAKMNFFSRRTTGSSAPSLVSFYEGTGRDHRGRHLSEILQWGAGRLELSHDYIQTLFPLPEGSGVNWDAPIIDRQVFDAFRSRPELRGRLRDSFQKILWFYGFKLDYSNGEIKVDISPHGS